MAKKKHFSPELFKFLRQLKRNNDKLWFEENKDRYLKHVRDPFLEFIADFATPLHKINRHFVSDPRPMGGSLFRIYRDIRFAKDKTPYKTTAAAQFNHEKGKNVHAPGYYLHLEPGQVFAGAGIWRPDAQTAGKIRDAIADNPAKWKRILATREFKKTCSLEGDKLIRPPRGYDPDHPLIEYLKYKDFLVFTSLTEQDVCSPGFIDRFAGFCRVSAPFVKFLCYAIGLQV